ncbi:MAG: inner membrane CreD family protein, partial [Candidatus Hydrogenedentes bacterium]|nr:inner membrane CreD family protein [Candidatus Hydrogenedentota bacterium]
DRFTATLDDKKLLSPVNTAEGLNEMVELAPGMSTRFHVTYRARGMAAWRYGFDPQVGRVQNLDLSVKTNFEAVDYPEGCLSPMSAQAAPEGGVMLAWQASDLITREGIGVIIPEKLNPGPLTSRITYFAPVCLIFFFVLVGTINILYKVDIHPMHYLFVAAGFFAFHLLLAYMAGLILIHVAFLISAVVSVGLVTTYLSAALRGQFPWKVAAAGQAFFLVLFSYSFFLKGITGLTVAIGSVVTLAVLMRVTAHVDWNEVFAKKPVLPVAAPAPPPLPQV